MPPGPLSQVAAMKWLFPSSLLIVLSSAWSRARPSSSEAARGCPGRGPCPSTTATRRSCGSTPATNAGAWERLVSRAPLSRGASGGPTGAGGGRSEAFPDDATAMPKCPCAAGQARGASSCAGTSSPASGRARDWVDALVQRQPPPLAIIGGSYSDGGHQQADQLDEGQHEVAPGGNRPLLLLTAATADAVAPATNPEPRRSPANTVEPRRASDVPLHRHVSGAHVPLLFHQPADGHGGNQLRVEPATELRPDTDPLYRVPGQMIPIRRDLIGGLWKALRA